MFLAFFQVQLADGRTRQGAAAVRLYSRTVVVPSAIVHPGCVDRFKDPQMLSDIATDYCVYCLVPIGSRKSLILLASSSTLLTFQLRPFSNSTEAVLLAVSLIIYKHIYERPMVGTGVALKWLWH